MLFWVSYENETTGTLNKMKSSQVVLIKFWTLWAQTWWDHFSLKSRINSPMVVSWRVEKGSEIYLLELTESLKFVPTVITVEIKSHAKIQNTLLAE